MSDRELTRRKITSAVLREAWKLLRRAKSYSWAVVMRLAWRVVTSKARLYYTKAAGVAAAGTCRQSRLQWLLQYDPMRVSLVLLRERNNRNDFSAVKVVCSVDGGMEFTLGYMKAGLAEKIAPLLDIGYTAVALMERVTGVGSKGLYGLNFRYAII